MPIVAPHSPDAGIANTGIQQQKRLARKILASQVRHSGKAIWLFIDGSAPRRLTVPLGRR